MRLGSGKNFDVGISSAIRDVRAKDVRLYVILHIKTNHLIAGVFRVTDS